MKISITLPFVNPSLLHSTLDNIEHTTREHEVEVIVCSPFEVGINYMMAGRCRLVWVKDDKMTGNVAAHAMAYERATGDFITAFSDDHHYVDGWDVLVVENFLRREVKPFCLGLRQVPQIGTVFGIYYPYFPMMRRADVPAIGGWFDASRYVRSFGDCDLGLRVWFSHGRCEWSDQQIIKVVSSSGGFSREDMSNFLKRWTPVYGEGWDTSRIRGFDIDVPLTELGSERTCWRRTDITGNRDTDVI